MSTVPSAPHAMPKLGGGVEGFNIDMINAIGEKMGRKIEIFAGEFSGLIPGMNAGKISFVGAPTTCSRRSGRRACCSPRVTQPLCVRCRRWCRT